MDAAAAGRNITLPGGRNLAGGDRRRTVRRFVRGLCLALGGVLAAGALVAMVFVASAWLVRSTLSANPYRAKARFAVAAAPPADHYVSVDASGVAAPPRMPAIAAESTAALDTLVFDASAAHARASAFRLRTMIAPQLPTASVPRLVAPQAAVAALTTGSIPDAGTLQDGEARAAPPWHSSHRVAVYDIAGETVYLPNGERLEAHSGLGHKRDDPRYTRVKNQGPTPPNVYDLTLRERLFHGVRAIRLNPVDERRMFGRDGMLAHSYLLGPSGQSNGCVSFKNYSRFLRAFLRGEIDRLVVVARLGTESWRTVAARARLARRYADSARY